MPVGQLDISFEVVPEPEEKKGPKVTVDDVRRLVVYLEGKKVWTKRHVIESETGIPDRIVRASARAGRPRIVSYPGSAGYKLWEHCTVAELATYMNTVRNVRDDADQWFTIISRAYHSGYRGGEGP